jgi:hypothetical protein
LLDMLLDMIRGRRRVHVQNNGHSAARKETAQTIYAKLQELRSSVTDRNVSEKTSEFYALVKSSLKELLSIKYEATFQEISEELDRRKHFSAQLREELDSFMEDVSVMEYGYLQFREIVDEKRHEQEKHLAEYLKDLEKQGEKVDKKLKKKIAAIVSDNVPHSDREFLLKTMDRFKSIVHQIS